MEKAAESKVDGTHPSICRLCLAFCPIEVDVENGRAVGIRGDRTGTPWDGYICPKGRALPDQHNGNGRLLRPIKREAGGAVHEIANRVAVAEVTSKLKAIIDEHGPGSVAFYIGTGVVSNPTGQIPAIAFMRALKSSMIFSAATIDKPAANVSTALHGNWIAGAHRMEDADAWMIIGGNPVIAKSNGAPPNNPGMRLKEAQARGVKLIVIDPRLTETAKRAKHHLQLRPGEDPTLLAAMLNLILSENLCDDDFLARHAEGITALRQAVAPFSLAYAAKRCGVTEDQIASAARDFAQAEIGGAICATGPSFSTHSNLTFYLALCLNTVCGHWPRAGQRAPFPNMLLPEYTPREQAYAPYPAIGPLSLSATGLRQNASGMPTAGLSDQILTEGPGRIRALLCAGGNPVLSWPDQARTEKAMAALDLLVCFDYHMTATAELADYVVPPPLTLEIPGHTQMVEWLKYIGVTRGMSIPWAQYTPAIVAPPEGSDLMDEGEFLCRVASALDMDMDLTFVSGHGAHLEVATRVVPLKHGEEPPSVETLLQLGTTDSRIPLEDVKRYPRGKLFDDLDVTVAEAEPGNPARLQVADPMMMAELAVVREHPSDIAPDYPLLLVSRRVNQFMNSVGQGLPSLGAPDNPLLMHPDDMAASGFSEGQIVRVISRAGSVETGIFADQTLRRETVSLSHGFGARIGSTANGAAMSQLTDLDEADSITGIPRMSGVAVRVLPIQ